MKIRNFVASALVLASTFGATAFAQEKLILITETAEGKLVYLNAPTFDIKRTQKTNIPFVTGDIHFITRGGDKSVVNASTTVEACVKQQGLGVIIDFDAQAAGKPDDEVISKFFWDKRGSAIGDTVMYALCLAGREVARATMPPKKDPKNTL